MSSSEQARLQGLKRQRAMQVASATLTSIAIWQLLFSSFAFGASRGPAPLRPFELVIGITTALILGLVFSRPAVRRRLESEADLVLKLMEGRHKRRVVVFDNHFTINGELILSEAVESADLSGTNLVLRYADTLVGGRMLRELGGKEEDLRALQKAMNPRFVRAASK